MRRSSKSKLLGVGIGAFALVMSVAAPALAQGPSSTGITHRNIPVCPTPPQGYVHCFAILHQAVTSSGKPAPNASAPTGLSPSKIADAYGWSTSTTAGAGTTIAIVDAYDDPTIEQDLGTFSGQFGLPPCTTQNGCFTKVNQNGGSSYPRKDSGWSLEISLDVEWAHAVAPGAKILLVEASSASFTNLLAAEDYASSHASYVSNSWGGSEFSGESAYDSHFQKSGVSYFVSSGDSGAPAEYPSASPDVISVGGTTLSYSNNSWTETTWSGSGGGCSAYETANSAQQTAATAIGCGNARPTPDVSLDANPNSGVSVYDSTSYQGQSGWFTVGGTSASSPMWAARSADAGAQVNASYVYDNYPTNYPNGNVDFRDIVKGSGNGYSPQVGYDLVTGLGSWLGSAAQTSGGGGTSGGGTGSSSVSITSASCSGSTCSVTASGGAGGLDWTVAPATGANLSATATNSPATVSVSFSNASTYTVTATDSTSTTDSASQSFTCVSRAHGKKLSCSVG